MPEISSMAMASAMNRAHPAGTLLCSSAGLTALLLCVKKPARCSASSSSICAHSSNSATTTANPAHAADQSTLHPLNISPSLRVIRAGKGSVSWHHGTASSVLWRRQNFTAPKLCRESKRPQVAPKQHCTRAHQEPCCCAVGCSGFAEVHRWSASAWWSAAGPA